MKEDPNKGIPDHVQKRLEDASRERFYADLLQAIDSLLAESGHDWGWLDDKLTDREKEEGVLQYITLRGALGAGAVGFDHLVRIGQCFGLEPYLLFRPRVMRHYSREGEFHEVL